MRKDTVSMIKKTAPQKRLALRAALVTSLASAWICGFLADDASALEESHIQQIEAAVVRHICSDSSWLACWGEKPEACKDLMGKVASTCLEQYLPGVRQDVKYEEAREAGLKVIKCLNQEFASTHPSGKKDSPECRVAPQHLQ